MAITQITNSSSQNVNIWSKVLYREAMAYTHLMNTFMGTSKDNIVYIHKDLEKSAGDTIKYDILLELVDDGKSGSDIIERNAEAMQFEQDEIKIDQHRFNVSWDIMSQQRTLHQLRDAAMDLHITKWGKHKEDQLFRYLGGDTSLNFAGNTGTAPDGNHYFLCGNGTNSGTIATDETAMDTNDRLVLEDIDYMREKALASTGTNAMRPVRIKGKMYLVLVLHPYVFTDLRQNVGASSKTTWMEIQQNAAKRGPDNPIFTAAEGVYNNVIIFQSPYIYSPSSNIYRNVLLGAQAACYAQGNPYGKAKRNPKGGKSQNIMKWVESSWDAEDKFEVVTGCCYGIKKTRFNDRDGTARDYGCMVVTSYSAAHENG